MKPRPRWSRLLRVVGAVALLAGAVDPLEGSIVILGGSALLLAGEILKGAGDRRLGFWMTVLVLIAVGVAAMVGLSSVGGVGGSSGRPLWWALVILPYPVGWLLGVGGLVTRLIRFVRNRPTPRGG